MMLHLVQSLEINLDEHRDHHDPDQYTNRQIHVGDLKRAQCMKHFGQQLA
jgi:hypothetical protein